MFCFFHNRNLRELVGLLSVASLLAIGTVGESAAGTISVANWINGSGKNVVTELNAGRTFVTNFKGINDLTVTESIGAVNSIFNDTFLSSPGNNPNYLTSFVGNTSIGTGNGNQGVLTFLESGFAANTLQFDFSNPLTSGDKILLADIDVSEQIQISAFSLSGAIYTPVSLTGWLAQTFTGMTGIFPNSSWASFNPASGLFTGGASTLNEPLNVLTPNQPISRVVFTKINTGSGSTGIQFMSIPEPSTMFLEIIGGLSLLFGRRRKAIML